MSFRTVLAFAAAAVLSQAAASSTVVGEAIDRAQTTRGGSARIGVICNYALSQEQIQGLKVLLPSDTRIIVADARGGEDVFKATIAMKKHKVDFAMFLPEDATLAEGSALGRQIRKQLNLLGVTVVK